MSTDTLSPAFAALGLREPLLKALQRVGYETPSAIQQACIPLLIEGRDMVGQAQTGTGKTAAFALPLLNRIETPAKTAQVLVLAPTRELAIQVAEACQSYAKFMDGFHVLPVYGGQSYSTQLRQLKRGVNIIVGTPGRVMDHIRRGTLNLEALESLVLDEADEMLRMGFIDDVEWVLERIPKETQIALFSATMPNEIRRVAENHLKDPEHVTIAATTTTATTISQRYLTVSNHQKMEALTRILESEHYDGVITFVRTKTATTELAEKLIARGYRAEALNGDIPQAQRETVVKKLKAGHLDILVATDVVARGLDVERISHVINYDIPYDTEAYVHRIGRTGRAGRSGEAILFVTTREKRLLKSIEKATRQPITRMHLPGADEVNAHRAARFKAKISDIIATQDLDQYLKLVSEYQTDEEKDILQIAAALALMANGGQSLYVEDLPALDQKPQRREREGRERDRGPKSRSKDIHISTEAKPLKTDPDVEMKRYRIDVGYKHEVKPGNIVGAIANEADIESRYIGHIEIFDNFTVVDLPDGMPKDVFMALKNTRVCQQKLNIRAFTGESTEPKPKNKGQKAGKFNKGAPGKPAKKGQKKDNSQGPRKRKKKKFNESAD